MLTVVLVVCCSTGACCGFNVAAMSVAASFTISTTVTPSPPELERRWVFYHLQKVVDQVVYHNFHDDLFPIGFKYCIVFPFLLTHNCLIIVAHL